MTRFDEKLFVHGTASGEAPSARAIVAEQPAVTVLAILLASATIFLAAAVLLFAQVVRLELERTMNAVQLLVFLQPQSSRADAEALRGRIEAVRAVASATLRTREDALAALATSGLPVSTAKSNPLPDVWIVGMRGPDANAAATPLAGRVEQIRQRLLLLPGVDTVRVDGGWIDSLDRWAARADRGGAWLDAITVGLALLALFGIYFLAGRAIGHREASGPVQALATMGMIGMLLAFVVAGLLIVFAGMMLPALGAALKPAVASIDRAGQVFIVGTGALAIVTAAVASAWGGSRR